jgi:hypothetical protein
LPDATEDVADEILEIANSNAGSEQQDKLEDVAGKLADAVEELEKSPPNYQAALGA